MKRITFVFEATLPQKPEVWRHPSVLGGDLEKPG